MVTTRSKSKILKTIVSQAASVEDTDHQSTHSAALIGSNDDLSTEILLQLPVKSILRFKSVSKHWRWLLSDKYFTIRFNKHSKSPGIFAGLKYIPFDVEAPPPPSYSLDFHSDLHDIKIVQSCNGLLLCVSGDGVNIRDRKFYVLNPTTKQFSVIPSVPGGPVVNKTIVSMCLAFYQTDCVHYKVICVRELELMKKIHQIQVYSSDTREWKTTIESFTPPRSMAIWGNGFYWNGAICWTHCPLFYKVDDEELHLSPMPWLSNPLFKSRLWESRGHLHLILPKAAKLLNLDVYEILSDHSGLFVKYQLQLDEVLTAFLGMMIPKLAYYSDGFGYLNAVIDIVRGEKDDDTFLVLLINQKLIKYSIHDESVKLVSVLPSEDYFSLTRFHRHTEVLAYI